jgi:arylsulfatase A-like enzyme
LKKNCEITDQPVAALLKDLKQRGLLDDTLVVWGGEFGRTVYCQGTLTADNYGRDHHPRCFTIWLAGGGTRPGFTLGETDEFSYNVVRDPVAVHDLHATMLHLLGVDHKRLTYFHNGRQHHGWLDANGWSGASGLVLTFLTLIKLRLFRISWSRISLI